MRKMRVTYVELLNTEAELPINWQLVMQTHIPLLIVKEKKKIKIKKTILRIDCEFLLLCVLSFF
jgi:hypothetical protein